MATGIPHGTIPDSGGRGGPSSTTRLGPAGGWTVRRVVTLILGLVLTVMSLGFVGGGATLLWADQALRHDGYLTTGTAAYSTSRYALASGHIGLSWGVLLSGLVGDTRVRVTAVSPGKPVFVAVGPTDLVTAYLSGTAYVTVKGIGSGGVVSHDGGSPGPPQTDGIWAAQATGTGTQVLHWTPQAGDWTVVVMNLDGSAGVAVRADVGVSAPGLLRLAIKMIIGGIWIGLLSAALIWVPLRLAAGAR